MTGVLRLPLDRLLARLGILERLEGGEDVGLEYKLAQGGLPKDLWSTVSAFANTNGGWIILGIKEERAGRFVYEGVGNAPHQVKTLHDNFRNPQFISRPVCGENDVFIESLEDREDRRVIVIRVPAVPRRERPIYIRGNPYTGTFIRRHSGDYQCSKEEVDRMIREAGDKSADAAILPHFGLDDLDRATLEGYRRRFQTLDPASPKNSYDDRRFLEAIGAFGKERPSDERGITVAGLLMFGTPETIREWRTRHRIDFRRLPGEETSSERWDERILWEGNLLGAFDAIYPRLVADLPVRFRLQGATRIDEGPVHVALREALVNLLVHADYAETSASLIQRSPEGYFFRNPGSSRVPEEDLLTGDRSDPRNPLLVGMFRYIGLAEEAGSGIPKIRQAWRELGLKSPRIEVGGGPERYEFSLELRYAHLLSEEDRAWLEALGNHWTEAEQLALVHARHEEYIDNQSLRSITGLHPADITRVLARLRERGLLTMVPAGRATHYVLSPTALATSASARSDEPAAESSASRTSVDDEVWAELQELARPASERRRLDPEVRDEIVVSLCARTPLSLQQLATLLNRKEVSLREVVRSLLDSGRLTYLHPEQPSHPRQKYRTVSSPMENSD